ncbi:MAG: DUF4920 domain-containing protein [Bacteroidota bacterium]
MKTKFFFILILLFAATLLFAAEGKKYGKKITVKKATSISSILSDPKKYDGKRVMIEGTVTDVCQKMGCWINIAEKEGGESIKFKVEDGVIVFPKDSKGKIAKAQGKITIADLSKEDLMTVKKHEAEETGKAFDSTSVTGPKTVITIQGEGAILK